MMTPVKTVLSIIIIFSFVTPKRLDFTGSTPSAPVVRNFLGIPVNDSIDFIRWNVAISGNQYLLKCNYGIAKQNTNGFINNGKTIELAGEVKKEDNIYVLHNNNKLLKAVAINSDLVHFLDENNQLLRGNGGWSFTINSLSPLKRNEPNMITRQVNLKDSVAYEGRTPCGVPEVVSEEEDCYKLKWYIMFYANAKKNQPTIFNIKGSPWYKEGGRQGTWEMITEKNGRVIYRMYFDNSSLVIDLLRPDENILLFMDKNNHLLVGNEDFSYTLSRL